MLTVNRVLAAVLVLIGAAALVETALLGGGQLGFLVGVTFIALGVLRWRAVNRLR